MESNEKYSKLIDSTNYTTEDLQKYNDIKHQLADLMPELVLGEDQYGNKILGNSESIKAKTELLERQLAIQEKLQAIEQREKIQQNYDSSLKSLEDAHKALKSSKEETTNMIRLMGLLKKLSHWKRSNSALKIKVEI